MVPGSDVNEAQGDLDRFSDLQVFGGAHLLLDRQHVGLPFGVGEDAAVELGNPRHW